MSKNIDQVFIANPIATNLSTDLMYFGRSPYTAGNDAAMTYANFSAQFGAPYTAAALTRVNDTNVTLTLGGTPATALLQAVSVTAGWSGQLAVGRGGTGSATFNINGVVISGATTTTALSSLTLTNGQIVVGATGAAPAAATLTAANGTVITNGTNTITVGLNLTLPASSTASQHIRTGSSASTLVATNACHFENIQVFTGSGTFNVPADVDLVYAIAQGGGASGGGGTSGTIGSGGGSGSWSAGLVSVTPSGTVTVTIGGTSTGGTTGNPGANGNDSSFGASVIGKGGSAGAAGGAVAGGNGGVAGTGTITTVGNPGGGGASIVTNLGAGYGGMSPLFGGGGAVTTGTGGNGGANTGGGGAGGRNANSGGNGAAGIVIVYY